ncbi:hypothetical protein D3C87_1860370 [compost metagenome]
MRTTHGPEAMGFLRSFMAGIRASNEPALDAELFELAVKCRARYAEALRNFAQVSVFGRERIL